MVYVHVDVFIVVCVADWVTKLGYNSVFELLLVFCCILYVFFTF